MKKNEPLELRSLPRWAPWVALAWGVFVLSFFIYRLPLEPSTWMKLLDLGRIGPLPNIFDAMRRAGWILGSLGCGVWALWLTLRSGRLAGTVIGLPPLDAWLRTALEAVLGIYVLQLFWLGSGFLNLWRPSFLGASALGCTTFFLLRPMDVPVVVPMKEETSPFLERLLWWGACLLTLGVFVLSVLPETFYDSMAYILAMPQQWVLSGGVTDMPGQLYAGFNLGASLWYQTGLMWGGTEAARAMAAAVTPLAALAVGGWVRQESGVRAGRVAAALVATFLLLVLNGWAARSDGLLALTLVAGFYALDRSDEEGPGGMAWVTLAGMMMGLAFSMKYIAVVAVPVILLYGWTLPIRSWASKLWAFFLGGALVVAPWALKDLVHTGNPVYPYLPHLFGGRHLPEFGYVRLLLENRLTTVDWLSWPPVPWTLCQPGYAASQGVGPLALMVLPVFILFRFSTTKTRRVAATLALYLGVGLLVGPVVRFLMAGVLLLFVLVGWAWSSAPRAWTRSFSLLALGSMAVCGLWMLQIVAGSYDPLGVLLLREDGAAYSERMGRNPYGTLASWAAETVPPGGRLLLVGDGRALGYPCRVLWNSVDDDAYLAVAAREDKDAESLMRRFHRDGITHVAFNMPEAFQTVPEYRHYELSEGQWRGLDASLRACLTPVRVRGGQALFAVRSGFSGAPFMGVEPMAYLSPPALAAKAAREAGDETGLKKALGEAAAWFPQDPFFVQKKETP